MSLLAWYPLIKDGLNQGLDGVDLTTIGSVTYTAGKLGNASTFAANLSNYYRRPQIKLYDNFSFACWYKLNATDSTTWQQLLACGRDNSDGWGFRIHGTNKNVVFHCGNIQESISTGSNIGTWHHVCMTIDNGVYKTYIDGVRKTTGTVTTLPKLTEWGTYFFIGCLSNSYYPLNGQVQDVRVYDHVLSTKEVKELSKGLMLHVPLSWGARPNLAYKSDGKHYFDYNSTSASTVLFWQSSSMSLESGVSYTVSFDAKIDSTENIYQGLEVDLYPDTLPQKNWQHNDAGSVSNQWKHFTWTTSSTNSNITNCSLRFFCDMLDSESNLKVRAPLHVKNIKIEKGTCDTPYVPHVNETAYTRFGFGDMYKEDCSGYNTVMTKSGTPIVDDSSPRGLTSTNFNQAGYLYTTSFNRVFTAFTVAYWIKVPSTITEQHFVLGTFDNFTNNGLGIWRDTSSTSYSVLLRDSSQSTYQSAGKTPAYTANTWYHFALTWDGTTMKQYNNGALHNTVTYGGGSSASCSMPVIYLGTSLYANKLAQETDECSVSDFRIYATTLSEDDIKELYNVAAQIDKSGKIYCSSFIEI